MLIIDTNYKSRYLIDMEWFNQLMNRYEITEKWTTKKCKSLPVPEQINNSKLILEKESFSVKQLENNYTERMLK